MYLENFNNLFHQYLNDNNKTYVSHKCERLLASGENYGSVMLKVEVTVRNKDNKEEIISCVAKTPPPKSWIWELFTTVVTFKKEIGFYSDVLPALKNFTQEKNLPHLMDFTAKYYGSRVNLQTGSTDVDDNAVLLLENLKENGYDTGDRFVGFDRHTSIIAIKNMATMHAVFIAYKQYYPKNFEENLLPHISERFKQNTDKEAAKGLVESYINILRPLGGDMDLLREKLLNSFFYRMDNLLKPVTINNYFTLAHNDMWTNNIMLKVEDGQTTNIKFVDFQVTRYVPGAYDLVFFLYTSVQLPILKGHLNELVDYYFETFMSTLASLQATSDEFSKENFVESLNSSARLHVSHVLMLLGPIFTKKGKAKDLAEFSPEDFKPKFENVHENFAPRLHFIVNDAISRGWV